MVDMGTNTVLFGCEPSGVRLLASSALARRVASLAGNRRVLGAARALADGCSAAVSGVQLSAGHMSPSPHRGGVHVHVPAWLPTRSARTRQLFLLTLLTVLGSTTGNRLHRNTDYTAEGAGNALSAEHQRVVGEAYDGGQLSLPAATAISVVDYGADRTASADSATAFQRALAAAAVSNDTRTVYAPLLPPRFLTRALSCRSVCIAVPAD